MKMTKFKLAYFNNKKRQLSVVYVSGKQITVHYSDLGIQSNIKEIWIDKETKGSSLGIQLDNGQEDYMPYDQPLAIAKDPDFLLQTHVEILIARIKEHLKEKRISKRYLAERLYTSDNQIQRLLNPKILNKNLVQLYHIAALLGLDLELRLKAA